MQQEDRVCGMRTNLQYHKSHTDSARTESVQCQEGHICSTRRLCSTKRGCIVSIRRA